MARRRKSSNPETPWLKYVLVAGGCYFAYRLLKDRGILGGNGDDYTYVQAPVVKEVEDVLKKATPSVMRTAPAAARGTVTLLAQKKKSYDITLEKHQQAPVLTAQAQAQYDSAQAAMNAAKANALRLLEEAKAKSLSRDRTLQLQAEPLKKAAQVQKDLASSYELKLPVLKRNVDVLKSNESLNVPQLKKLEGELAESVKAREVGDFMQAAALATGGGVVAVER